MASMQERDWYRTEGKSVNRFRKRADAVLAAIIAALVLAGAVALLYSLSSV